MADAKDVDMNDINQDLLAALLDSGDFDLDPSPAAQAIPASPASSGTGQAQVLSFSQRQLWFLQQIEPTLTAYNLPRVFRLHGRVDVPALQRAFQALIDRHAILRTTYKEGDDGQPVQQVQPEVVFTLIHDDLSAVQQAEQAQARALVDQVIHHVFDLARAPMLVARLITLSDDEHLLAVCLHHIASDAWSNPIVARDLAMAYAQALRSPQRVTLPSPRTQYADHARWQRDQAQQGGFARELAHWNKHLGPDVPALALPTDFLRPGQQVFSGAARQFDVDPALAAGLQALCRSLQCTPFMLLMAAWQAVLGRHCGQADFAVGVPHAGRHRDETQDLVGFFVSTQAFRVRLRPEMSLRQLCLQVRDDTLAALDHADLPLEVLLESRSDRRDAARSPLFQVLFGLQVEDGLSTLSLEGLQAQALDAPATGAKFELSLDMTMGPAGLRGRLEYMTALFAPATIERLIHAYRCVLAAMAHQPDAMLSSIELLDAGDQALLQRWSRNRQRHDNAQPVHHLIEAVVQRQPHAVALVSGDASLSYAELDALANRWAHRLSALGVGPDVTVGIATERSLEMVIGLLAIVKAGGAYVPMDPDLPAERLAYMLDDSGVGLLLTQSHLLPGLPERPGVRVLSLDTEDVGNEPATCPRVPLHDESLAYVIYTSGSTGRPKGAANRHRALFNRLAWMQQAYGLTAHDVVLQKTPFSFDVSVWEFFWPLMVGARLIMAAPGDHRDPARLVDLIVSHGVSTLHFVPSMLQAFMAHDGVQACTSLRRIVCSGEALPADLQVRTLRQLPWAGLYNLYGPTEAAIDVTHWTCRDDGVASVPIGAPISDTRTHILDGDLNEVAPGVAGELYLGGEGLARGYLHRAGLTAERFVADPLDGEGGRLYRTGDLVRWREDGQIEYLGRIDHQVKVRGFRIELGEVEAQLLSHGAVREAVVVAHEGGVGGTRLVAYVTPQAGQDSQSVNVGDVREHLLKALPDYMVPGVVMVLRALPLNANGKLDRKALPQPELADRGEASKEGAQGEAEEALSSAWQQVLGLERVGRHENFFELGGDSILSLQIVAKARQGGWRVSPKQLFERQTVAELAQVAQRIDANKVQAAGVELPRSGPVPLLPIQADFFEVERPAPHHWNQALLLEARERVDAAHIEQALQVLVTHHEALRLRYRQEGDRWHQALPAEAPVETLLWVRQAQDAAAIAAVCDEAQRSLDLSSGPLLRAVLIEVADGSTRLLLVAHHLVIDGVSWRILLEDLQMACSQLRSGQPVLLPAATTPWRQWAMRLHADVAKHDDEFEHWAALPDALPRLPCDDPQGSLALRHQAHAEVRLDEAQTQALLKQAPTAYRTQVNDLLLTALGRALCSWSGGERIRIDLEGHGREDLFDDVDLSRTVGWFTSLYPVVIEPMGDAGDAIKRVKEQLRQVPRRGLGHGLFRHHGTAQQREALRAAPRAQVVFNYLGQFDGSFDDRAWWSPANESAGACMDEDGPASHELSIGGQVYEGVLRLHVRHSTQRHQPASINALLRAFRAELLALVEHCVDGVAKQGGVIGLTPSDVPLAGLAQAELDALRVPLHRLADLYPLSPMQAGMLFHSVLDPQGSAYLNQVRLDLDGVDEDRLRAAWQSAWQRHEVLRAGFLHERSIPLQWVDREAELPLTTLDWGDRGDLGDSADLNQALETLARDELAKGFDLAHPPLMRLVLVRLPRGTQAGAQAPRHHLLWTCHHLLLDGWSTSQLLAEVLRHHGGQQNIARPASGWRDHIAWLATRDAQAARRFWEGACAGLTMPTRLATGSPAGPVAARKMGLHGIELDTARTAQLVEFARRERVTINTLVQAAWALLLKSRTGSSRVCFGATTAGRPADLPGIEQALGLFINTLPVVVDCPPDLAVGDWLRRLQGFNLAAREHEHTPLNDIQRWSGHGGQGLFDNIVVFENYPVDAALNQADAGGLRCTGVNSREETSYPMTLAVMPGDTLRLKWGYEHASFDAATVAAIAQQVEHLLGQLVEQPQRHLGEVPLLDAATRAHLRDWGRNEPPAQVSGQPVHRLIEAQAKRQPDAIALILGDERIGYADLNRRANQIAHHLMAQGIGPETLVGVAMERSFELLASLLSVLKAGAAYVPLDPAYPADRLAHMGRDSGMALLLTQQRLQARLSLPGVRSVAVDALALAGVPDHDPDVPVQGGQLAYVIYTSGSTGLPKGVAVSHGPLAMHCEVTAELYEMGPQTREFHFLSFAFDGAHERWLTALSCGASLVLRDEELWSAERTLAELLRQGVTNAGFPPAYLQQLAAGAEAIGTAPPVSLYSFGGEAMPRAGLELVQRALHPRILINGYGPTEAVVTPLVWKGGGQDRIEEGYVPIGRPVGHRTAHILDGDLNEVAPGVAGELYLGGEGLARGYLHRAGLTAERFVADPLDGEGGRLYRTGDLVRWREDGQIEYLGRIDHQVKVRGFRIELGEVEAQLLGHGAVREAVVVAHEGGVGGTRLVAYVTPQAGQDVQSVNVGEVREHLLKALPDYMVPGVVMVLRALPLNANGKVDRKALPQPELADRGEASKEGAQGEAEEALSSAWQQVLGLERVGRHENFFELGGDSILSLQIVAKARQGGWRVSPKQLFERQTVAELAQVAQRIDAGKAQATSVVDESEGQELPLSPIQRLFFDKALPNRHHWNQSVLLGCDEALDVGALRQALQAIVQRHAALRTAFRRDEQGPWTQVVGQLVAAPDLLWHRRAESLADVTPWCDEAQRSLDLSRGEVLRALLIDLPQGGARLLLTAHHLVVDGVSWRVMLEDLRTAYDGALKRVPASLPRTASFGQWVRRLQAHTQSGGFQPDEAHWRSLADTPVTAAHWPATHPSGSNATACAARASFSLSGEATRRLLKDAPAAYRTQVNDLLLTALARVLCRHRGTQAFLIDLEGHGREDLFDDVDLSRTLGWFTSVFPVQLTVSDDLGRSIGLVKEALAAVPHKGLGFGAQCAWGPIDSREALARLPRRDIAFNYLGQFDSRQDRSPGGGVAQGAGRWWPATESAGASSDPGSPFSHELTFNGQVIDGVFSLRLDHSAQRHDAAAMAELMSELQAELMAVIDHCTSGACGVSPSDFPQSALAWDELDALVSRTGRPARDIEDIHPLTAVQQGMLCDALLVPGTVVNVVQTHALFEHFDMDRLRTAWATVVARHAVLRTGFFWCGGREPVQVVLRDAELPIEHLDWRGRATAQDEWQALCDRELRRGFDLAQAPLMRLVVARVNDQQDRLVWTWHHLLMDGWSMSRLLGEVFTLYGGGQVTPVGPAFAEHVAWTRRARADDESFWRGLLPPGSRPATLLAGTGPRGLLAREPEALGVEAVNLDAQATQRLQAFATAQHVTLNTLVQAAWALVLAAHTGQETVTFGATMSGRSGDMERIDQVVGLCINTLPIVTRPDAAQPVGDWLRALLGQNMALRQREHVPLADIQRWAGLPGQPLFDTLLIFENFPVDQALLHGAGAAMQVHELVSRGATSSPLTLVVIPGETLRVNFEYACAVFDAPVVADLLSQFLATLQELAVDARRQLGRVVVPVPVTDLRRPAVVAAQPVQMSGSGARISQASHANGSHTAHTQARLADVWRRILGVDAIEADSHFFELGGDSLAAARLVSAWRSTEGDVGRSPRLALSTVFAHPVLSDMAVAIDEGEEPDPPDPVTGAWQVAGAPRLSPVRKAAPAADSPSPRLYLCPARAWHVDEYGALQSALQGRHEAWRFGCQPGDEGELAWGGTSVRELATRQAAIIRSHGADRPCCLLGWSVGGLVALETARQLQGEVPVAWVGLVDPSGFPMLRALLAQGQPLLNAEQRAPLEATLAAWLTERSGMRQHWATLLSAMQPIERDAFLAQVVAAHGPNGQDLPMDGPRAGSAEHALWSQMNCLRLGAVHPLPGGEVVNAVAGVGARAGINRAERALDVRIWRSQAEIEGLADMAARCVASPTLVPGTDHLSVLDSPAFHREVLEALDGVAPGVLRRT